MEKLILPLNNAQQAHQAMKQGWEFAKGLLLAGNRLVLEIKEVSKTREQEKLYHALIGEIAKQAEHAGAKWDAEDWKRFLLDQFARDTGRAGGKVAPSLDFTGLIQLGLQSRKFSKADAIEFVEWLLAWGANNGIEFQDYSE